MEINVWTGAPCKHEFYIPAGYKEQDGMKIQNPAHVFCLDCEQFINIETGERLNDLNLVHIDSDGFYVH